MASGDMDIYSRPPSFTKVTPTDTNTVKAEEAEVKEVGTSGGRAISKTSDQAKSTGITSTISSVFRKKWLSLTSRTTDPETQVAPQPMSAHTAAKTAKPPFLTLRNKKALTTLGVIDVAQKAHDIVHTNVPALLQMPEVREIITKHMDKAKAGENVEFLDDVKNFEDLCDAVNDPAKLAQAREKFQQIKARFIVDDAPRQVNIPGKELKELNAFDPSIASPQGLKASAQLLKEALKPAKKNIEQLIKANLRGNPELEKLQAQYMSSH